MQLIAPPEIRVEGIERGKVQRQRAGFAEFAEAHGQHTVLEVKIAPVQADGFADAHAGHGDQANQRLVSKRAKW